MNDGDLFEFSYFFASLVAHIINYVDAFWGQNVVGPGFDNEKYVDCATMFVRGYEIAQDDLPAMQISRDYGGRMLTTRR